MPELPEVQTIVNDLQSAGVVGRRIGSSRVRWERSVEGMSSEEFGCCISSRIIQTVGRRGKYIVFGLDGGWYLLVHLRMTGRLGIFESGATSDVHDRVILALTQDGIPGRELRFHDTRKFGRIILTKTPQTILSKLGPEPLDPMFRPEDFIAQLAARKRILKSLLLDQHFLAGLGNIYVDESLWLAKLHPLRQAHTVSPAEATELFSAIRTVLTCGIRNAGTTLGAGEANFRTLARMDKRVTNGDGGERRMDNVENGDGGGMREHIRGVTNGDGGACREGRALEGRNQENLNVFRRTGKPCPRCSTPVERIIVSQRSTHLCPECQH